MMLYLPQTAIIENKAFLPVQSYLADPVPNQFKMLFVCGALV